MKRGTSLVSSANVQVNSKHSVLNLVLHDLKECRYSYYSNVYF